MKREARHGVKRDIEMLARIEPTSSGSDGIWYPWIELCIILLEYHRSKDLVLDCNI